MAKALYGHLAADQVMISEVARLRRRVRELEEDLARLRADQERESADAVAAGAVDSADAVGAVGDEALADDLAGLSSRQEPALT